MYLKKILKERIDVNSQLLKAMMVLHGDTQSSLASAMGVSLSRLNAKINETNGSEFRQNEISFIAQRYALTGDQVIDIFFSKKVS